MKHRLLAIFLLFCTFAIQAQSQLKLRIIDAKTKTPLPFTTIYLKNTGIGTTSNMDGFGYLQVKNKNTKHDTLICNYIGYEKEILPVQLDENQTITIELKSKSTELASVEVVYKKPLSVKKILKNVIKNTTKNYSNVGVNFEALYRETVKENETYLTLNEAVVDIHYTAYSQNSIDLKTYQKWQYDDSYAFEYKGTRFDGFPNQFNSNDDKARLIAARTSEVNNPKTLDIPIDGGPMSLTSKDYLKYRYDFLNPKTFNNYNYQKKEDQTVKDKNCYVIHFEPIPSNKRVIYNHIRKNQNSIYVGNIYIDKKSFAVVKVEFQLIQNFDHGFYQYRVPLDYIVTVDYQQTTSNKWYLEKISLTQVRNTYSFNIQRESLLTATQELYITKIDTISQQLISAKNEWKHTRLTQLRTYEIPYDSAFWKDYELKAYYPKLDFSLKADLEKEKPLAEQYKNRFKQKVNLPKPIAKKESFIFNYPTENLADNYQWFARKDKQEAFYKYITEENNYADNYILPYKTYQRTIFDAFKHFYKEDTAEVASTYTKGDYAWQTDSLEELRLVEYVNPETYQVIFDYSKFKQNRKNCFLTEGLKMSEQHIGLIYTSNGGLNNHLVYFNKRETLAIDSIPDVYSFEWFNDSLLLYTKENAAKRSDKLYCRNINNHTDSLLLFEADLTFDIDLSRTKSKLVCTVQSKNENEVLFAEKLTNYPKFELFLERKPGIYAEIQENDGIIYALTNDEALNNKIVKYDNGIVSEIVPHDPKTYIQDFAITEHYVIIKTSEKSFTKLKYKPLTAKKWIETDFDKELFDVDFTANKEDHLSILYSSPSDPYTRFTFDLEQEKITKTKSPNLHWNPEQDRRSISTKRVWVKTKDGVKIPMTLIRNSNPKRNHKGLILKAYGMYGANYNGHGFNQDDFILLKEGYTIVYAQVRGGGEMGNQWHADGQNLNKENSFNDYIACAEYLIKKEYTTADHLVGYGNSAGGLLMGVVINRRPELFNTVILDHPYLDALTTMMMDTLPLTTDHYKEVGNPNDPAVYAYMKNYSPYQNIKKQDYPNLLFIASSNDFQTPIWQIAKYVAKIREYNTGSNEILFKTDIGSGHIGNTNGQQWMKDLAYKNAFIYSCLFRE